MAIPIKNMVETFAVLTPSLRLRPAEVTPSLYADLDSEYAGFRNHVLISSHEFSDDWSAWERHPAGDELVMILSGKATLVLKTSAGDESVSLDTPGSYVVIPRNTWHTAQVARHATMLFVTPGEGTENRESPSTSAG